MLCSIPYTDTWRAIWPYDHKMEWVSVGRRNGFQSMWKILKYISGVIVIDSNFYYELLTCLYQVRFRHFFEFSIGCIFIFYGKKFLNVVELTSNFIIEMHPWVKIKKFTITVKIFVFGTSKGVLYHTARSLIVIFFS